MNLYTSSSKLIKTSIVRSLVITFSLLTSYSFLGTIKILKPQQGLNPWQNNFIRVQRYSYQEFTNSNIVLVGSSLTSNIPADEIDDHAINLAMTGGCAQTGLEAVLRKDVKPKLLLVEINGTMGEKLDNQTIESIYSPLLYSLRFYFPIFREEYKPSQEMIMMFDELIHKVRKFVKPMHKQNDNEKTGNKQLDKQSDSDKKDNFQLATVDDNLREKLISQVINTTSRPIPEGDKSYLRQQAQYIKSQISKIERDGTHVILFDVPGEPRVKNTLMVKQTQTFMKSLFPNNNFDWIPEPPSRQWKTSDGIHLVKSDAKVYAAFLRNQLLLKKTSMFYPGKYHQPISE